MADPESVAPQAVTGFLLESLPDFEPGNLSEIRGDASTRRYFRYRTAGAGLVVALYPEPFEEEDFAFRQAADLLAELEIGVPRIVDCDPSRGIVLQEDVGDRSLYRLCREDPQAAGPWLERAVAVAARIQADGTGRVGSGTFAARNRLDADRFEWELAFFRRHFLEDLQGVGDTSRLEDDCHRLAVEAAPDPEWLCHRDFQVRNLFVHDGQLVVIDFQDMQRAPLLYDAASLVLDSIELPEDRIDGLLEAYRGALLGSPVSAARAAARIDDTAWRRRFAAAGAQRLVKALGTYGFQIACRGRDGYRPLVEPTRLRACRLLGELGDCPQLLAALAALQPED